MKESTAGVLAGMGPRAAAPFAEVVADDCRRQSGAKYDEGFPRA